MERVTSQNVTKAEQNFKKTQKTTDQPAQPFAMQKFVKQR